MQLMVRAILVKWNELSASRRADSAVPPGHAGERMKDERDGNFSPNGTKCQ